MQMINIFNIFKSIKKTHINSHLEKIRANLSFIAATKGREMSKIDISEIPKKWAKFGNTEDEWINIDFPVVAESADFPIVEGDADFPIEGDCACCIYKAKKGSIFPAHFHEVTERFFILNKNGKIQLHTMLRNETINFPNGVFFEELEGHIVKFLEPTIILIVWCPKFKKGWEADMFI